MNKEQKKNVVLGSVMAMEALWGLELESEDVEKTYQVLSEDLDNGSKALDGIIGRVFETLKDVQ